ncbi:CDP-diacylglycerol--glycerol-3-phosphate 3-phosphatidyltransferase [Caulobacter sp. S45]|uniref:CDP-diacylglycerol--glycerol-3-phosphate 3-phosphatidyltransferase n=1 Tax=Caulobacter sp. S45 TaxID=1641861 RepID=UPI001575C602|nr:CDP-diacylglycerol--glycerol-3-phosphate 3-phosphatidyltransferase [Caulobacter sp. S45]
MFDRRQIPNLLTLSRIACGMAVFALMAALAGGGARGLADWAFALFALGAVTDFFDGWLARRWQAASAWGTALDPIADKIAVLAAVLGLVLAGAGAEVAIPGFLILFREVFVSGLREAGAGRGVKLPVTWLAKWKTTVQLVALSLALLATGLESGPLALAATLLLWLAAAMTLWTGVQYARAFNRAA